MKSFRSMKPLFVPAVFALALGCGNKAEEPPPEPEVEIESEVVAEAPAEEAIDENAMPIPADYQAEMEESVTEENYKEELAAIEKELESES